jgi:hypothetical protein
VSWSGCFLQALDFDSGYAIITYNAVVAHFHTMAVVSSQAPRIGLWDSTARGLHIFKARRHIPINLLRRFLFHGSLASSLVFAQVLFIQNYHQTPNHNRKASVLSLSIPAVNISPLENPRKGLQSKHPQPQQSTSSTPQLTPHPPHPQTSSQTAAAPVPAAGSP